MRKIVRIDDHICLAFAGLTADARVLINKARVEAQSYRLTLDEKITVEHLTKHIAGGVSGVMAVSPRLEPRAWSPLELILPAMRSCRL